MLFHCSKWRKTEGQVGVNSSNIIRSVWVIKFEMLFWHPNGNPKSASRCINFKLRNKVCAGEITTQGLNGKVIREGNSQGGEYRLGKEEVHGLIPGMLLLRGQGDKKSLKEIWERRSIKVENMANIFPGRESPLCQVVSKVNLSHDHWI